MKCSLSGKLISACFAGRNTLFVARTRCHLIRRPGFFLQKAVIAFMKHLIRWNCTTLVHKVTPFATKDSFRSKLAAGFDYHRVAAIEKSTEQIIPPLLRANEQSIPGAPISEDLVEPIFHTPNVFGVQANSPRPGLLILNERWSNDWHARVNSRPAKVLRANFTSTCGRVASRT